MTVDVYSPLIVATIFALGLAWAEWQVSLQRATAERETLVAARKRVEDAAFERQRQFNTLWQELADSRGKAVMPESVMQAIAGLFKADLTVVWAADTVSKGYGLRGVYPTGENIASRLDKVAHASPCFENLRQTQRVTQVTDFARSTSLAFAMFCEEQRLQYAVLCPVLVRHELVGVLAFFYQEKPKDAAVSTEEMRTAANLFLCAL